jgi:prepilin-type N-terminal cleavage/methylation domain-containing protein
MAKISNKASGFTLLELMISLTIVGMVSVMIYAALNIGARAAAHGEARSVENQRARAALALITRQLKSAYPLSLQGEEGSFVYFFGEATELSFVSGAGRPEVGGLEKITYFLREHDGRRSLWVRTSAPTLPADLLQKREGGLREESEVLPDVEGIGWEYKGGAPPPETGMQQNEGRSQSKAEWTDHWDGTKEQTLPTAVRFSWRAKLGELPYEWHIEVPLYVTSSPSDVLRAGSGATPQQTRSLRGDGGGRRPGERR